MKFSVMNYWMVILVMILYLMVSSMETGMKFSLVVLFLSMYYLMKVNDFLSFFMVYEMVFVFIMFSIMVLGYSFERLMAGYLMMFYSFMFSSPSLMVILLFDKVFLMKNWISLTYVMLYFLVGSFMVKFPIFGFHYWLPVAHVEASTIGSMILAGVLLKLGGLGMWYVVTYMNFMVKFHWMSLAVPLIMVMILSMSDLKIMIAYSSVAHMSMVFYVMMVGSSVSKMGVIMMMFYHGFISPLMFWVVGALAWWKTRSLLVIKLMSFSYVYLLVLFFLFILNMSFPPFMGFLSEILMLKSLLNLKLSLLMMMSGVLFSCYYNIYLYWCFNNMMGMVYKMNMSIVELFMFVFLGLCLNF